jgi:hypothetical protein
MNMSNPIDAINEETITVTMDGDEAAAVSVAILKRMEYFDANANILSPEETDDWIALSMLVQKIRPIIERKAEQYHRMMRADLN